MKAYFNYVLHHQLRDVTQFGSFVTCFVTPFISNLVADAKLEGRDEDKEVMEGPKSIKKRKLLDKSIPNVILQNPEFAQDSQMYQDLLNMERKLDWTITRKRMEVQDALARTPTTTRTLRIFMSHTVSGQQWQNMGEPQVAPNFETGEGIPAWSFKIEGRLLEVPNQRHKDKTPPRKFSTLIKRMVVELDRDTNVYPEGNIVEWPRAHGNHNPALDGFTIRRTGDSPTKIRVVMYLEHFPEQYKVLPELSNVLAVKEDSRMGVIQNLWNYIKVQGLQDKVDRRIIKADDKLRPIFGGETMPFHKIPDVVNRYLTAADPIILHYTVNPTIQPPERTSAWDVEIKMEDTALKNKMAVTVSTSKESAQALLKIDEEIALLAQSLHNSHMKRTFLESFANDPAQFIQTWLESQSRDLESILGSGPTEGMTLRQEELKRSEFFQLPWVEEAVAIQEGVRLAAKGMA
uniref:DM2 domain-containing protein n=1 Tax=Psilocybe cubensis TaxID=181762 RepID=A0A8H7XP97_PSICU